MTKSKYTPGLWIAKSRGYLSHVSTTRDEPFSVEVCGNNHAANARLIAAAPDLLAALRKLIDVTPVEYDYAGEPMDREFGAALTEAEAILARIEGE